MRSTMELDMSWALGLGGCEKEVLMLVEILPVRRTHKNLMSHTHGHVHISVCVCGTPNAHQRGTWLQAPAAVWEWIPSFSTRVQLPNYYASTQLLYGDTQPITIGHSSPSKQFLQILRKFLKKRGVNFLDRSTNFFNL